MKNDKLLFLLLIAFMLIFVIGCKEDYDSIYRNPFNGNGNVITVEKNIEGFNGILLKGNADINIYHAEYFNVKVTTDSNIQDIMVIEKENDNLSITHTDIGKQGYNEIRATKLIVDIYLPKIDLIDFRGLGDIIIHDGNNSNFEVVHAGVGNVDIQNYEVNNVIVYHMGLGDVKTWATNSLTGVIAGQGNILYKGNPSTINVNITGIGNVQKL